MIIDIVPVAKPRMTQADKWKKRPAVMRYRAFCDELRLKLKVLPIPLDIEFGLPMPESWSVKKRAEMCGTPHMQKCDIDNLCKAVMDAMLSNDSHVWSLHATKRWAIHGYIQIRELENGK